MTEQWDSSETSDAILHEMDRQVTDGEVPNYARATAVVRDAFNEKRTREYLAANPWPPKEWTPEQHAEQERRRSEYDALTTKRIEARALAALNDPRTVRFSEENAEAIRRCFDAAQGDS